MPKMESSEEACRRRGRPAGKNRIPLSTEERKARNAQYERERRNKTSDAMARLAEAAGYEISISNGELLASVVDQLRRAAKRGPADDIEHLRRCNENLMQQIAELEQRLGWSDGAVDGDSKENITECRRNTKASFAHRNVRRKTLHTRKELTSSEHQAFKMKLYSDS